MAAILLPVDKEGRVEIDDVKCRHYASQHRDVDGVKWGKDIKREDFKKLPGHDQTWYARTQFKGPEKLVDVFFLKDEDEIHIYQIL